MANHKILATIILDFEGGWANDPVDQGGMTMKGVILDTYTEYCKRKGKARPTGEELRRISNLEWDDIFKTMFWDAFRGDEIANQSMANILVDWLWASGPGPIRIVQRMLSVKDDGVVGAKTVAALNAADQRELFNKIKLNRIAYVDDIVARKPAQQRFIVGWKRRINSFNFSV